MSDSLYMDVQIYECIKSVLLIVYTYLRCVSLSKAVMKPVDCPSTHWGGVDYRTVEIRTNMCPSFFILKTWKILCMNA